MNIDLTGVKTPEEAREVMEQHMRSAMVEVPLLLFQQLLLQSAHSNHGFNELAAPGKDVLQEQKRPEPTQKNGKATKLSIEELKADWPEGMQSFVKLVFGSVPHSEDKKAALEMARRMFKAGYSQSEVLDATNLTGAMVSGVYHQLQQVGGI